MRTTLTLQPSEDVDSDELEQLTAKLRRRLLDELDITTAEPFTSGQLQENTKPLEPFTAGVLAVTLSPMLLRSVIQLVQTWIKHQPVRSAKITMGDDSLELTHLTNVDQQKIIDSFIERHSPK